MAMRHHEPVYFTPPPVRGRYLQGLWKDAGSAPAAPDPVATAQAQGDANIASAQASTALNRYDQITPYGNMTWKQDPTSTTFDQSGYDNAMKTYQADLDAYTAALKAPPAETNYLGDGGSTASAAAAVPTAPITPNRDSFSTTTPSNKWTATTTLDPRVQSLLDSQLQTSNALTGSVDTALARATKTLAEDPNANLPASASASQAIADAQGQFTDPSADIARSQQLAAQGGQLAGSQLSRLNDLYGTEFNYDSATAMPGADEATRKSVEDALYANSTARLDPQYQQNHSDLDSRLAAQGITQGSQAWQRENQNLSMAQTDAYANARNTAVSNSTDQMKKLFDMGLASRQQGVTEANTLRAMPTSEAATAAQLNSGLASDVNKYYGTETAQNTAASQVGATNYNLQANERATALQEEAAKRQQVLNELNALRTGAQVTMPQFMAQGGGSTVGAAPVAQSAANNYTGALNAYNADVGSANSANQGTAAVASALIAAFA